MAKERNIQINEQVLNRAYTAQRQTRNGRSYMLVPVVMMVEGVHHGSRGPMLHTAEELSKAPDAWNGVPVVVYHPQDKDGNFVLAEGQPDLHIGFIENSRWEGDKLRADVLVDIQKLAATHPEALATIQNNKPLEVSTGMMSRELAIAGEWNGESYEGIATDYKPDHLALLPGEKGACSWEDGCGLRVNQEQKQTDMEKKHPELIVQEVGMRARLDKVRTKVDAMDNDQYMYFVEELYEDSVIYRKEPTQQRGQPELLKQNYSMTEDEQVEFTGDPQKVRREVEYIEMNSHTDEAGQNKQINNQSKKGGEVMSKEKSPCLTAKVEALISNQRTQFTGEDKEWLEGLSEAQLNKLEPVEEKPAEKQPTVNREQALEVLKLEKLEDYLELMPTEMKEQVNAGLKVRDDKRKEWKDQIQANTKNMWTDEELELMNCATLEKLSKSVNRKVDYSGNGAGNEEPQTNIRQEEQEEEKLLPPDVARKQNK